jgi:L-fucose isomerase-like protein
MFERDGMRDSTGSSVGWAVVKAALDRAGVSYKGILGPLEDEETIAAAASFCRAATTASQLRRSRIGLVGYASMGMYSATFDHVLLRFRIGPEVEHADAYSIIRRAEALSTEDAAPVIERLKRRARLGPNVRQEQLDKAARVYLALKGWCEARHLDAVAFKCQYEFSQEYGMVGCVPLALLTEDGIATSCEGDVMLALSMLTLHLLTGQEIYYGDVLDWSAERIYLSSCGLIPYETASAPEEIEIIDFPHPGFEGLCNSFTMRPGRMTWLRFAESVGGHFLDYGTGTAHLAERRQGWAPAVELELDGDVDAFIQSLTTQHYAVCYGDLATELEDLARILGVPARRI